MQAAEEFETVTEAAIAARAAGCSERAVVAALEAIAARDDVDPEGAYAAGFVFGFAKAFAGAEAEITAKLGGLLQSPLARGREKLVSKLFFRLGMDVDVTLAVLRESGASQPGSLAARIATEHVTLASRGRLDA